MDHHHHRPLYSGRDNARVLAFAGLVAALNAAAFWAFWAAWL